MAMSLGFHIIFAAIGIAMPVLMVIAEVCYRRTGTGPVLSCELGLLFPGFMKHAGPLVGMPFSLEGFAFFLEAIFLGIYLYGWERVSARLHWFSGWGIMCGSGLLR